MRADLLAGDLVVDDHGDGLEREGIGWSLAEQRCDDRFLRE